MERRHQTSAYERQRFQNPASVSDRKEGGAPTAPHVLIIDDEEVILRTLSRYLISEGYDVAVAPVGP